MFSAALLLSGFLLSETPDTLQTAVISARRAITVSREDTLSARNISTVTDILLQSPGLVISDNGGFAGLKKVNLRGLGSPHTTIFIDGVKVGDVQSGQADLGMLPLDNVGAVVIDYAQNSMNFRTERPKFQDRDVAGKFGFTGGSFGTFLPHGRLDFRLSDNLSLRADASGTFSRGDFPYGDGLSRANNDISQVKAGLDLFGLTDGGDWMAKAYYNGSDRGTPGSTDWPSTDRQTDRNAFVQGLMHKAFSPAASLNLSGKVSSDKMHYSSEWGDSDYSQTEAQLNASARFGVMKWLDLSAVASLQWDGLKSTSYDASRTDATAVAGASFKLDRLRADFTFQYEGTFDRGGNSHNVFSPSAGLRYKAADGLDIVGFARRAYRAPTFNELYYPGFGNPDLRPEDAWLTDLGLDWRTSCGVWTFKAKVDGFYNHLTDKITSAPSPDNPSLWLPYNIGEVRSAGLDVDAGARLDSGVWRAGFDARYSFQNAENVPFLSKHTVVLTADVSVKGWSLDAVWNYRGGRRDSYGEMPDWHTLDLILGKAVTLGDCGPLVFKVIGRNLADFHYELNAGYPMQGRSVMGGVEFNF